MRALERTERDRGRVGDDGVVSIESGGDDRRTCGGWSEHPGRGGSDGRLHVGVIPQVQSRHTYIEK